MIFIHPLRKDIERYIKKHDIDKKWLKARRLFSENPRHPSLNTELLIPKEHLIYSFRIDKKYRALFYIHKDRSIEIFKITNHYH